MIAATRALAALGMPSFTSVRRTGKWDCSTSWMIASFSQAGYLMPRPPHPPSHFFKQTVFGSRGFSATTSFYLAKHLAKNQRRLVDDQGEENGVDDSIKPTPLGVLEREGGRRKSLATARRHGEGEEATIGCGAPAHVREDFAVQMIDWRVIHGFGGHFLWLFNRPSVKYAAHA